MIASRNAEERGRLRRTALLFCLITFAACTSTTGPFDAPRPPPPGRSLMPLGSFNYRPLDPATVKVQPEGLTVEHSWVLELYTLFHSRAYKAFRLVLQDESGEERIGHLLLPPGPGPHPTIVAFEILDGPQDVSEGMAKAFVNRGYAVARLDRRALDLRHQSDPEVVRAAIRNGVIDARRLIDWLVTHPKIDPTRMAAAGVSLGSIQALLLASCDPRMRGGYFVLSGGDLPGIFYESTEGAVREFRDRLMAKRGWTTREQFVAGIRPYTESVDPLSYAQYLKPSSVAMATGRFDAVVPQSYAQLLWESLGRPTWWKLPCSHYTLFPFFWWTMSRGADHFDRLLAPSRRPAAAGL